MAVAQPVRFCFATGGADFAAKGGTLAYLAGSPPLSHR